MVTQVGALRVAVGADISGLQTGMKRAERQVARSAGVMSRSVKNVNASLSGLGTVAGVSLGGAGLLAGAAAFLKIADAAKSLQAQLKLATAEFGSLSKANKDVRSIAESTRSDLLATAELYASLQRNSGQLGTTQEQVARATKTVAEAFKISGAATSEQSAATRQLIQAFQSGVLRGDEFNSIMENAPRLAKLLADSLGVTTGALRKMAEEGQLTADKLVKAFTDTKFTEGIDAEFKQLPVTFDEAMTGVYNAAIIVFSAFDRGGQFSNSIANFVSDGTGGFKDLEEGAYNFGKAVSDTFTAIETIREALGSMRTEGVSGIGELIGVTYSWRDALHDVLVGTDRVANAFANLVNAPGNATRLAFPSLGEPIVDPFDMAGSFRRKTELADLKERFRRAREASAEARNAGKVPSPFRAPPKKAKKGRTKQPPRDRSEDVTFQFEQELLQAQLDVLRAQQSIALSMDQRAAISLQILDKENEIQQAALDDRVRRAERDFAEKKITSGALEEVKIQAGKLRAEYASKNAIERKAIADDLAADKARDAAELIDSGRDIELEKLQNEAALKETASERRAVELRILAIMKEQERARLNALIADKDASELARAQAQQRLDELDAIYAGRADEVRQGTRGPMEDWLASLPTTAAKAEEALEQLQVQGFEGLIDAALQLSDGFDSAKDALLNILKQFLLGLARMELQKLAGSVLSGGIPGFAYGGYTGNIPSTKIAGVVHGREGVLNTLGMRTLGIPNLEALNRGAPLTSVSNDNSRQTPGRSGDIHNHYHGVRDFDSFRRNERQMARSTKRTLGLA